MDLKTKFETKTYKMKFKSQWPRTSYIKTFKQMMGHTSVASLNVSSSSTSNLQMNVLSSFQVLRLFMYIHFSNDLEST